MGWMPNMAKGSTCARRKPSCSRAVLTVCNEVNSGSGGVTGWMPERSEDTSVAVVEGGPARAGLK